MHSRELAMTCLLALYGCEPSAATGHIRNDSPIQTRANAAPAATAVPAPPAIIEAAGVPAPVVEPTADGVIGARADAAEPVGAVRPQCRARVCPEWRGAAEVNPAARVRPRDVQ